MSSYFLLLQYTGAETDFIENMRDTNKDNVLRVTLHHVSLLRKIRKIYRLSRRKSRRVLKSPSYKESYKTLKHTLVEILVQLSRSCLRQFCHIPLILVFILQCGFFKRLLGNNSRMLYTPWNNIRELFPNNFLKNTHNVRRTLILKICERYTTPTILLFLLCLWAHVVVGKGLISKRDKRFRITNLTSVMCYALRVSKPYVYCTLSGNETCIEVYPSRRLSQSPHPRWWLFVWRRSKSLPWRYISSLGLSET